MPGKRPRLAVTIGDAAGVGPELVLRLASDSDIAEQCQLFIYGNHEILQRVAASAGLTLSRSLQICSGPTRAADAHNTGEHILYDFPFDEAATITPGRVHAACGRHAHAWICEAVRDIQTGRADVLVTAPINKAALHAAGIQVPGHTELLASLTNGATPCMAFHSDRVFVSLATIHEALRDVPGLLTIPGLLHTIRLTCDACARFKGGQPRIAVLALNPHAGEGCLFGNEEHEVIAPAIAAARAEGLAVSGPLVPDTAFTWLAAGQPSPYDGYVAMYHDQGLIPFKMAAFDTGVNVTLGLPLIRTSPDHGTAFDIAWQGKAAPTSFACAIRLAARMVNSGDKQ
ncbi:MAG: 4-hydroxythreonine-4-phosphate dehydrogenase PdxA [Kiritimatiellae bacterium]|jgi:4-hydroxythreonine-4-phosphate dehydrogenase|nr:4-hydroxythreonine-4-phosphate dehydrogenase PdxA [Kiritimatiellia bacterium]MDD3583401.1 4-hydroxythreonine-4-phosphate dehydrogenase PdxA [Kiritimatiellia bacterium]HON48369.1 4-hydroxythreonine-4-phosphate dehydrogenase PdxA [Kiritimatiellia bacterium]